MCLLIQIYSKEFPIWQNHQRTWVIVFCKLSICVFCICHHWVKYMFDENVNFRNGSFSSPVCNITSCSNSNHVRYEGNGSPSIDANLSKRICNMVEPPSTRVIDFANYLSVFFCRCHHWVEYMLGKNVNFWNGSTSSPGHYITSCSI